MGAHYLPPTELDQHTAQFARAAADRLTALQDLLRDEPSPDTLGEFLAQAITGMLEQRVGSKKLLRALIRSPGQEPPDELPPIMNGAIYDSTKGPPTTIAGRTHLLEPRVCAGFINVRPWASNLANYQHQLWLMEKTFFRRAGTVMGVVVRDPQPIKKSQVNRGGHSFHAYDRDNWKWAPIYILFSFRQGKYQPHWPALHGLLKHIHEKIHPQC